MHQSMQQRIREQIRQYGFIVLQTSMAGFITEQGLAELKQYKYKSCEYTWLDNALTPYWEWVVKWVPLSVAPNLITFVGWLLIIVSYVNILRYDYTLQKDVPNYCFILTAFCVWAYSTLDSIDGKQARRTKSSSPLGQLFDHGCDSFSTAFFVLAISQAFKLDGYQTILIFTASQGAFWASSWVEYHTGVLKTNVGQLGVTQIHVIVTATHLVTGIMGQKIWQISTSSILPKSIIAIHPLMELVGEMKLGGFIITVFGFLIVTLTFAQILLVIIRSHEKVKLLKECSSMGFIVILQFIWVTFSFFNQYRGLVLLNFGLFSSLIICKTIISAVAKLPLITFHFQTLPLAAGTVMMIICQLFGLYSWRVSIFWGMFALNTTLILQFLHGVVNQITDYLGIYCFTIVKKRE